MNETDNATLLYWCRHFAENADAGRANALITQWFVTHNFNTREDELAVEAVLQFLDLLATLK